MKSVRNQPDPSDTLSVRIIAPLSLVSYFQELFQAGFQYRCHVGTSIEDFLLRQLGLDRNLVNERINTIFLDGSCVDHIETAVIEDGSVLALSGALPGLAGASLRRNGYYASMRDSITHFSVEPDLHAREGTITIKLFNVLIRELGSTFLKNGIVVNHPVMTHFFQERQEDFWKEIGEAYLEDRLISGRMLAEERVFKDTESIMISIQERGSDSDPQLRPNRYGQRE